MQIQHLNTNDIKTKLSDLIEDYDEFHWAVAWARSRDIAKQFLNHKDKFKNVTFGINFCHTDPDIIDSLIEVRGAKVATKFTSATYHPKIYCFQKRQKAAAIVGSANFTYAGLNNNIEAAVFITGKITDPFFVDLLKFTEHCASFGEPITKEFADAYRKKCEQANRLQKPKKHPISKHKSRIESMTWSEYVDAVQRSKGHDISKCLDLLRAAQTWFASVASFSDLSLGQRQAIAGNIVNKEDREKPNLDLEWGWFGSMRGMGDFANRINENDNNLATAIDLIPNKGEVSKTQFEDYIDYFTLAFKDLNRSGDYPTASRLLAIKRPDTFLCICKPNIEMTSKYFQFKPTTLELKDYWNKIIEVIQQSEWYNESKPTGNLGELWEYRVAMLDSIFYQP